jgi:hypothetical protein
MKTTRLLKLFVLSSIIFYSCQKEVDLQNQNNQGGGGNTNKTIIGTWNFVGIQAHTRTTVTVTDGGDQLKSVTVSDYITKNNKGTITFTSNQFSYAGLSYDIDTVLNVKSYENNVLVDDSDLPFVMSYPVSTASTAYVRNNADSLTFPDQVLGVGSSFQGGGPTGPMGARIAWSGDTLLLKIKHAFSSTVSQGGIPAAFTGEMDVTMKMKK